MFRNSTGGFCQDNGSTAFYTFPEEADFEINGVSIPLGGMTVECYGGRFDTDSMAHFTNISSLLFSESHDIFSTSIFINDNGISGNGYPARDSFLKYGIDYLSPSDFKFIRMSQ